MEIANTTALGQTLEQRQQLSARTLQSLELLHLPLPELEARLTRELETNPVLEETSPEELPAAESLEAAVESFEAEEAEELAEEAAEAEELAAEIVDTEE